MNTKETIKITNSEKYEKMWKELSKVYGNFYLSFDVRKANNVEYAYIDELMNKIKQKYFPVENKAKNLK